MLVESDKNHFNLFQVFGKHSKRIPNKLQNRQVKVYKIKVAFYSKIVLLDTFY